MGLLSDKVVGSQPEMGELDPIVVGGNGHAGTRVFAEILKRGGVFTGIGGLTKRKDSEDLRIIALLSKWAPSYVYGTLGPQEADQMRRAFARRLRLYFPMRKRPWGFKNPRTMLLLPFFSDLFPRMKFVHVIRDGRDLSLGNAFVGNPYVNAFESPDESNLSAEERMILFWGRSNRAATDFGESHLGDRYLRMKWEDLCTNPGDNTRKLLHFAGCPLEQSDDIARVVRMPASLGRWRDYPDDARSRVESRGRTWLTQFGYQ